MFRMCKKEIELNLLTTLFGDPLEMSTISNQADFLQ